MNLSRVELCDLRSPEAIARGLLAQIPTLEPPVPVVEIALALGIADINVQAFDGFDGMLLTDRIRSKGGILANDRRGTNRARFTIAHELGHFLMEWHELDTRIYRLIRGHWGFRGLWRVDFGAPEGGIHGYSDGLGGLRLQ